MEIDSDTYFDEITWKIYEKSDASVMYAMGELSHDSLHVFTYCLPQGSCKVFELLDDNGDGMFPDGIYRIYLNDVLLRQSIGFYGKSQKTEFGCPPGASCNSTITMLLGSGESPNGEETWYSFTPTEPGLYNLSTCDAACPAKIWVYSQCNDILITENLVGSLFFADSGCPDSSASATLHLSPGVTYIIRIRYAVPNCSPDPLPYILTYLGPIVGCMDSTACNFDPLATVSSDCIYPGDPNCPQAPDIAIDQNVLVNTLEFSDHQSLDICQVEEGCLRGFGNRHLIKFTSKIDNIGNADFYVGAKPDDPNDPSSEFIYDPCHGHWHYLGYAEYILFNSAGKRIPIGSKNGFCILDEGCQLGWGPTKYRCDNMGISAGCFDVYTKELTPCQWIDVTDIPADDYTLVARVNWARRPDKIGRVEKTFDNNWAQACFKLLYDGSTPEVIFNADSCKQFTDCSGEVFGNAQPDCNGICNGPALYGDLNQDTLRNETDVQAYLTESLNDSGMASPCNDLYEDGLIHVYDAALLQECTLHQDSQQYWIQRFPCQFPGGIYNALDLVNIGPGTLDTVAKTFDILMANPYSRIMAYEFKVSGLLIDSVINIVPGYQATPLFNAATGEILALSGDESFINKSFAPTAFVRVYYSTLTDHEVCVSEITAVVNNKYQLTNTSLANPNCLPVEYVGTKAPDRMPFTVFVQPNPMREITTLFFDNKEAEPVSFVLTDVTGRIVRSLDHFRGESINVSREALPEGTYIFTIRNSRGSVSGKILMH